MGMGQSVCVNKRYGAHDTALLLGYSTKQVSHPGGPGFCTCGQCLHSRNYKLVQHLRFAWISLDVSQYLASHCAVITYFILSRFHTKSNENTVQMMK